MQYLSVMVRFIWGVDTYEGSFFQIMQLYCNKMWGQEECSLFGIHIILFAANTFEEYSFGFLSNGMQQHL